MGVPMKVTVTVPVKVLRAVLEVMPPMVTELMPDEA